MNEQSFSLLPFPALNLPGVAITGRISLQNNLLSVHYTLDGNIDDILVPPLSPNPSRKDELWKATCFEFFVAVKDQPGYWEFNMSPSGDWNAYRMEAYRRIGFREELGISQLPFAFKRESERYLLDVSVDLRPILQPRQELQVAITAILRAQDGSESFWALVHPAPAPDFHLRDSFILPLATQAHPLERSAPAG